MADLEYVRAYIDHLIIITKGIDFGHLQKLATILTRLQQAGVKVNANKSWFAQEELEYLHYWITKTESNQGKAATIQNISAPTKEKELSHFIGIVNYYQDMWIR
jgi:hypothetical protein